MWISRRLRINTFYSLILASLLLISSGCSEESKITDTPQPDKISEISIPDYSGKAIVAINTSTSSSGYADLGTTPRTLPSISIAEVIKHKLFQKDIPDSHISNKKTSLAGFDDPIETLTHTDTTHTFEAYDIPNGTGSTPVYVDATLQYGSSTSKCLIYVEDGYTNLIEAVSGGTETLATDWNEIGQAFDDEIYTRITEKFGPYYDIDSNEKVIFLFYNVDPDENDNAFSNGFLAGYFWPQDIVPVSSVYTNKKDMVYMNLVTYGLTETLQTLAHEYTHLVAYSVRRISDLNDSNTDLGLIDTWLNEGIAEAAAHYALDSPLTTNITVMKTGSPIRNGEVGIFHWTGSGYNYPLVYSFVQYARIQGTSGYDLFSNIIQHSSGTYSSLEELVTGENDSFSNISDIVRGFHIANVVNQETGIYGYKDERSVFSFVNLSAPESSTTQILPGAAVNYYPSNDDTNSYIPSGADSEIHYYRINADD